MNFKRLIAAITTILVTPVLDAVNRFFGYPDIRVEISSYDYCFQYCNYNKPIDDNFPRKQTNNDTMFLTRFRVVAALRKQVGARLKKPPFIPDFEKVSK